MNAPQSPRFGRVARVNAPRDFWRNLYVRLIAAHWSTLLVLVVVGYIGANAGFAALYLAVPHSIAGARPGSFTDAFHFSVQTMATIGYGTMTPRGDWANALVAVEALCGLLGLSLATSVSFAKLARPTAHIVFSEIAVVRPRDGVPTLMFRAANARGNDVLEASVRVALLRTELTGEGEVLRRLHELRLTRSSSPVFLLSWTIMHPIDGDSPLHGVDLTAFRDDNMMLIVTLSGLDGTTMQTVHARTAYHHDQLRFGERFVDVVSTRADGTVVLDHARFHDSEPLPHAKAA